MFDWLIDISTLNFNDWSWEQAGSVFTDPKTYAYIIVYSLSALISQALTAFLLIVIKEVNTSSSDLKDFFCILPFILAAFVTVMMCYISGKN